VAESGSNLGWNAEKNALFGRWNVEKNFAGKDVAYELFTFSVFHFFSEMSSRSVRRQMRTNTAVFPSPAALYPSDARGKMLGKLDAQLPAQISASV
jgi:hypothetical protein